MWTRSSCGGMALAIALAVGACGGGGGGSHQPQPLGRERHVGLVDRQHHDHGRVAIVQSQPSHDGDGGDRGLENRDSAVHRIVANDGSFDTGDISPGATSRADHGLWLRGELSLLYSPRDDRSDWSGAGTTAAAMHRQYATERRAAATSFS